MKCAFSTAIALFFFLVGSSQDSETFVTQDSVSNGMLSVTMDTRIDALLEEKENACSNARLTSNTTTYTRPKTGYSGSNTSTTPKTTTTTTLPKNPFGKEIDNCKLFPKLDGYKIQILYTKSSEEVNKIRAEFARSFPGRPSESVYLRPDFKVRAGEYLTREAASRDLKNIKKKFPSAIIVRSPVYCKRAIR